MRTKADLHEYQQSAVDWIYEHDASLALCPVGAGKTAIAWTAIVELIDAGVVVNPIVIAPLRVAQLVWAQERDQWAHLKGWPVEVWAGEPANWPDSLWKTSRQLWGSRTALEARVGKIADVVKRRKTEAKIAEITAEERRVNLKLRRTDLTPGTVTVTSYENIQWLCDLFPPGAAPWDMWVFDEIGKLKNPTSPRYKAVRKHTAQARIVVGLNATPAPEGFEDLFTQVNIVDGGKLWGKSFYQWRQKWFAPADWQGYKWRLQLGARERLLADLNTIAFRVDEADLSYQRSMEHGQIEVDLPAKARDAYDEMVRRMAVELEGREDLVAMSAAASSVKLRQISNGFIYDEEKKPIILHEEKAHALADLLDAMGREPLLVAYEFTEDLDAIKRVWKNVPYLGQGISGAQAAEHVERWNKRELPVLALHWMSAGHGLNLQAGGSHICWYALPWSLEGWQQTNGRIDRQGQTRRCYSHAIMARDSMDQKVWEALQDKDVEQQGIIASIRKV